MTNEKKIELIRGYLAKPNCAGVEVEWREKGGTTHRETITECEKFSFYAGLVEIHHYTIREIIGDPKPIAIELEPLKERDKVWLNGLIGTVVSVDGEIEVAIEGGNVYPERHELIKQK